MTTTTQKEVMSRAEAAEYVGICKTTLDRLNIPKIQIRRRVLYRKATVDQWLANQTEGGRE
jgi:excisionase family DNA binding protein